MPSELMTPPKTRRPALICVPSTGQRSSPTLLLMLMKLTPTRRDGVDTKPYWDATAATVPRKLVSCRLHISVKDLERTEVGVSKDDACRHSCLSEKVEPSSKVRDERGVLWSGQQGRPGREQDPISGWSVSLVHTI